MSSNSFWILSAKKLFVLLLSPVAEFLFNVSDTPMKQDAYFVHLPSRMIGIYQVVRCMYIPEFPCTFGFFCYSRNRGRFIFRCVDLD